MKRTLFAAALGIGIALAAWLVVSGTRDRRPVMVCLGDSLTSCGGVGGRYSDWLARFLPQVHVVDAGIGGDTLQGGRVRFACDALRHQPDILLIALGANDFWQRARPLDALRADLEYMVSHARNQGIQVVVASCFGDRHFWEEACVEFTPDRFALARAIAQMERAVCAAHGAIYVPNMQVDIKPNRLPPYWDESDHPNAAGNEQVALRLLPAIRQAIERLVS